jgi:hypothetical protein
MLRPVPVALAALLTVLALTVLVLAGELETGALVEVGTTVGTLVVLGTLRVGTLVVEGTVGVEDVGATVGTLEEVSVVDAEGTAKFSTARTEVGSEMAALVGVEVS